jgi:DNA processing protein
MAGDYAEEEALQLALCFAPGVGSGTFRGILQKLKLSGIEPAAFFDVSKETMTEELGIPQTAAAMLADRRSGLHESVAKYRKQVGTKPVRLLTLESVLYPKRVSDFLPSPPAFLFAYGNLRVLNSTTFAVICSRNPSPANLEAVERAAEQGVLSSKVLVGGTNTDAYQRAAVVPLRWGAPRILVLDRGLFVALGSELTEEPFRTARLWRYKFDPETDLVISRNRPFDEYAPSNQKYRDDLLVALSDELHGVALRPGGNMDKLAEKAKAAGRSVTSEG